MRLTSASSKTRFVTNMAWYFYFYQWRKKKHLLGNWSSFNLCQLLVTEHVPSNQNLTNELNALTAAGALMTLIEFILSNVRRFYSSMANPLAVKGLRVVRKRIGLTAQTAGCLRCEVHSLQSLPFIFVCLLLSSLFLYFSQFSPQRTFQAHLFPVIFLSDTVLSFTFSKEIHSKAAPKQHIFNIQIKTHLLRLLLALQTNQLL